MKVSFGRWKLPERTWLGAAVVLALVFRLVFAFGYWVDKPMTVDQIEYLMLADNLQAGNGVVYDEPHRLMRSPGYPVFLATVRTIVPGLDGVRFLQAILGALSILLVADLGRRLGGARAGVAAAVLLAFYPPQIFQPAYVLSESLYTFMALGALILTWRALNASDNNARTTTIATRAALAGVAIGATILTRPEFLLFLGLIALYWVASRRVLLAAAVVLVSAATVAPWPLYNVFVQGRTVMLSSRGGPNLWMGNNEFAVGDGDVSGNPPMDAAYNAILAANHDLPPERVERIFYAETFRYVREQPLHFVTTLARKAFFFWAPIGVSYRDRSALFWAAQALSFVALLGLAARALPRLRAIRPAPVVLLALLGSVYLTCLVFFPLARYRVPVFDPVLISLAAVAWSRRRDG